MATPHGTTLPNGTRIVHGSGIVTKTPFTSLGFPVTMFEMSASGLTTLGDTLIARRATSPSTNNHPEVPRESQATVDTETNANPKVLPVNVPETGMGRHPSVHADKAGLDTIGAKESAVATDERVLPVNVPETSLGSAGAVREDKYLENGAVRFNGQIGLIDFTVDTRLPRHVHIAPVAPQDGEFVSGTHRFTTERILVLNGYALVELCAEVYVIPPRSLVTIAPGVPHTWTACPGGVSPVVAFQGDWDEDILAQEGLTGDGSMSQGGFLMVYEYEEETGFFPTRQTELLEKVEDYVRCEDEGLEGIRFPALTKEEVVEKAWFLWGREVRKARH